MKLLSSRVCGMWAVLLVMPVLGVSQERVAGGSLQQEASWSALKHLAELANSNAMLANTLAQALATCNDKKMLYSPSSADKDANGCIMPASPTMFTIRFGVDAAKSIKIQYNLSSGAYSIISADKLYGKIYVNIPKLDYNALCGDIQRDIELVTTGLWYDMPLSSGHQVDFSVRVLSHQMPTCDNGLVGIAEVYDPQGTDNEGINEWSLAGVLIMKAQ